MSQKYKRIDDVKIGDKMNVLAMKDGTVQFIKWFENDFQDRGYLVLDDGNKAVIVTIYKGESSDIHAGITNE